MMRLGLGSLAVLVLGACSDPGGSGSVNEIAGTTFFTTTSAAEQALSTRFRGRPLRYLAVHTEGVGWRTPGLRCSNVDVERFVMVGLEGLDVEENRRIYALFESHNARLRPSLPVRWGCSIEQEA